MARKKIGSDTWHFCTNCQHWPESGYTTGPGQISGERCNECLGKIRQGTCHRAAVIAVR